MKAPAFTYHDPQSVDDLIGLLARVDNARLLAGGQSLMPMLNMRFVLPDHVIDLNRIEALAGISSTARGVRLGAMTRQCTIELDPTLGRAAPIFAEALKHVGHVQTRSRGTIGGSLCHLDPSAELPCLAALYDAVLDAVGPHGTRSIPINDWAVGYMTSALEPNEALIAVHVPLWAEPHGHGFAEFARRHGDYAIVAAGALLALDPSGRIKRAAIALSGAEVKPVRLATAEAALIGQMPTEETIVAASEIARSLDCVSDAHISAGYRKRLAVVMTKRALVAAAARAQGGLHA